MVAVYSYWNKEGISNASGFNSVEDFLVSISLSMLTSKKHFDKVELVTNDFGKDLLIDKLNLPFTSVKNELSKFDYTLNRMWWGYTKIVAYALQEEPFLHIDNDAFIFNGLPERLKDKKLIFQSIEAPFDEWYGWYRELLKVAKNNPAFPKQIQDNPVECAFNCGIVGGNDLSIFKEWLKLSTEFVMHSNNEKFYKGGKNLVIHQNLLHEQYFISSLAKQKGLKLNEDIGFLLDTNKMQEDCRDNHFTHLWGTVKREKAIVTKLHNRLKKDFPEYYWKIKGMNL